MGPDVNSQIPPELLEEIFGWVLRQPSKIWRDKPKMDQQGRERLIQLMLVCKRWREVALCANRLWSKVYLRQLQSLVFPSQKLSVWFGRAKAYPKTLNFDTPRLSGACLRHPDTSESGEGDCHLHDLLAYLKNGPPLHGLGISSYGIAGSRCTKWLMRELQSSGCPTWSSIRNYNVPFSVNQGENFLQIERPTFTLAVFPPSLSSLQLGIWSSSADHMKAMSEIAPTTLKPLKSLVIHSKLDLSPIASLLQFCPNLQHLGVTQRGDDDDWPMNDDLDQKALLNHQPIPFPHLTSLNLDLSTSRDVYSFFQLFRAPKLESVRTRHERQKEPKERYMWNSLHSLQLLIPSPYPPPLRRLTLFARSYEPPAKLPTQEFLDILSDLPATVQHLTLENITFDAREFLELHDIQIRRSTWGATTPNLLPALRTLEMINPGFDFDLAAFIQYLKRRVGEWTIGPGVSNMTRLRNVVFRFDRTWTYYQEMLKECLEQHRDDAILRELEASFGVVMDLFVTP